MKKIKVEIHIDCDPMARYQEYLGKKVFKILGQEYREPDHTFFGDWVWKDVEMDEETEKKVGEFLKDAYEKNMCRYAQW